MTLLRRLIDRDPRLFQVAALSAFLAYGLFVRAFEISPLDIAAIFAAALATQAVCARAIGAPFDALSPMITALSLTLLLRAEGQAPLAAAAVIAIASKFILRVDGKHLFNPANIAIVAMTTATSAAWTTPGQWGSAGLVAALMAGAGAAVASRAARLDAALIFLGAFAALTFGRALWLGDPLAIPLLRLQNGALILFAFFMITDPKTTPDGRLARAAFCAGVAALGFAITHGLHRSDGIFLALAVMCLLRPLLERADPAPLYQWRKTSPALNLATGAPRCP